MKLLLHNILVVAVLMLCCTACIQRPKGVKSEREMIPVVTDMTLVDTYLRTVGGNSPEQREAMMDYVLEKHGMSRAEYDSTMVWYARNVDEYYELTDKVNKELTKKQRKMKGISVDEMQAGDLWPYPRFAMMSPLGAYDGFNFSIPTADVEKGERLKLKMRFNDAVEGDAILGVEYENGVSNFQTSSLRGSRLEMNLQTDTALKVKRIFLNMVTENELKRTIMADSISLAALPFDSVQYYQIHSLRRYSPPARRKPVQNDSVKQKDAEVDTVQTSLPKPDSDIKPVQPVENSKIKSMRSSKPVKLMDSSVKIKKMDVKK